MKKLFLGAGGGPRAHKHQQSPLQKLLIAASIIVLSAASVSAADLAPRPYTKAPAMAPVMTYNWTGCYIGGNVGGGWARTNQFAVADASTGDVFVPPINYGSSQGSNFIGGAQIGCDYQFAGNWVAGVQGMFDFGNVHSTHRLTDVPTFVSQNKTKDMFTVTARVGYLLAPQVLAYVKGGGAFARTDHDISGVATFFVSENANGVNRQGWTVGGGLEWMFAPGWSVFGEYNYMDFGQKDIPFILGPGAGTSADVVRTKLEVQQALVGVNYKFSWGGPLVARY
jgi:outer membrane immunogenic protein